jgi:HEPN domain-containing protein
MLDVEKNIAHWQNGAKEALETADDLINRDHRVLHGLFFVHLALEKIIKAHIWRVKKEMPPRIHNLNRLAEVAGLPLDEKNRDILAEVNEFNIEGRYSDLLMPPPSLAEAKQYLERAKGTFEWLTRLF